MNNDRHPTYIEALDQIEVLEKALELACEKYYEVCGMEDCPVSMLADNFTSTYKKCETCYCGGDFIVNDKGCCWVDYFKYKAKEIIKNE